MWQWQLCQDYRAVAQLKSRVTLAAVDQRSPTIVCMQLRHDHSVLSHDINPIYSNYKETEKKYGVR